MSSVRQQLEAKYGTPQPSVQPTQNLQQTGSVRAKLEAKYGTPEKTKQMSIEKDINEKTTGEKIKNTLGIFGGKKIGEAIGTKIAKRKFEKEKAYSPLSKSQIEKAEKIFKERTGKDIDFSAEKVKKDILRSETFKGPTTKQIVGDVGQIATNFIPVGKVATGIKAGIKTLPVLGKAAKPIANITTGLGVGYSSDVTSKLSENKDQPFTPGIGTAIGGILPTVPYVTKGVGRLTGEALGVSTGTGFGTIKEGFNAVKAGGKRAEEFQSALRGTASPESIVQEAKDSLGKLLQDKRSTYQSQLSNIAKDKTNLDVTPINNEVKNQLEKFGIKNNKGVLDFSQSTLRFNKTAQTDIQTIVDEMKNFGLQKGDRTAVGVDSLKRAFQDLYSPSGEARAFVEGVRKATRKVLDDVPGYNELTKTYQEKNGLIEDIYKGLSLGDKASTDTAFRKLTSALRTNNEMRRELILELDKASGGFLSSKIAGQQLSEILPRGLIRTIGGAGALGGIATGALLPVLKAAIFTSPRFVGEMINAIGITGRNASELLKILEKNLGKIQSPGDAIVDRFRS